MDEEMDGIASGLSNVICKDGQTTITANIPFNNRKITGLGDATAAADALNRQTGDARYLQLPSALTALTDLADGDIFGVYDLSATADRGVTYASLKTELTTDFRADGRLFSSGVATIFYQATAPTGWTKNATAALNDAAIRTVTDTNGGSTGGSAGFTTAFASRTITQANLPSVTLPDTLSATTGITNGTLVHRAGTGTGLGGGGGSGYIDIIQATLTASTTVNGSVTSGGSGEALSFAVKYANMIHCTKD